MKSVVTYLNYLEPGKVRLVIDDASASSEDSADWVKDQLFTHNDYDIKDFDQLNLSKEEFALIGENLVMRLLAGKDMSQ